MTVELLDDFDYNLVLVTHTGFHNVENCINWLKLNLDSLLIRLLEALSQLLEAFAFTHEKLSQGIQGPD